MLRDNGNETLQAAENRSVDDDRPTRRLVGGIVVRRTVLEVETFGELEVELDRRALERPAERVADGDVDLRPVERAIAWVELPLAGILLLEGTRQLCLRLVPCLDRPEVVVGTRGQLELEIKTEQAVDVLQKVEQQANLVFDLFGLLSTPTQRYARKADLRRHAKDVGIVLDEPPHTRQARQRPARLVSVHDTELGHAYRQLFVTAIATVEDEAVPRTIHRLQRPLLLFNC